jgi:hypothetical protein
MVFKDQFFSKTKESLKAIFFCIKTFLVKFSSSSGKAKNGCRELVKMKNQRKYCNTRANIFAKQNIEVVMRRGETDTICINIIMSYETDD